MVLAVRPEVGVDDLDGVGRPAALKGPLPEGVLEAAALLVGEDLMRARLADVDEGLAARGGTG